MTFISKKQVIERTGLSGPTIWRRVKAGDFPQSRQLTPNRVGWMEAEINEWEESRPVGVSELPLNFKEK